MNKTIIIALVTLQLAGCATMSAEQYAQWWRDNPWAVQAGVQMMQQPTRQEVRTDCTYGHGMASCVSR